MIKSRAICPNIEVIKQIALLLIILCFPNYFLNDFQMFSSITMTTCSTTLALGLMPLCLYGYTHFWVVTTHIKIPYSNMGTADSSLHAH